MERYCISCKSVSRQLGEMFETRRRGRLFEPKLLAPDPTKIFAHFGTVAGISRRTDCSSYRDLAQEITRWEKEDHWTRVDHQLVGIHVDDRQYSSYVLPEQQLYVITDNPADENFDRHLVNFYPLEKGAPHDEWGRLFDTHQFDIRLVKSWLQCCDLTHGEYCRANLIDHLPPDAFPSRILLVDIERQCLSYGALSDKYIALSYVWGKVDTLRTKRSNLLSLLEPSSIDLNNKYLMIPESIRDFLRPAARLEIRYAWVDSLCIVQDSKDLQEQLTGMAAIFASTYLTVCQYANLEVSEGVLARDTRNPSEALDWMENHPEETHADWRYIGFSKLTSKWPDMRRWCEVSEEYYTREVSFDSDASNAIAGLLAVKGNMSPGGFFHGLPELFFDTFLLSDVNGTSERMNCEDVPSWSFLGWKGGYLDVFWWRFSINHTFINQPDIGFGCDCEIGSIVEWRKQSQDGTRSVPIVNRSHIYRSGNDLPEGWTKHVLEEEGKVFFTHESIDDFRFRFPIILQQSKLDIRVEKFSHHLRFIVKRGWLNLGSLMELSPDDARVNSDGRAGSLEHESGKWAGAIRLHSSKSPGSHESTPQSQRVELIAVATGKVRNDAFPKPTKHRAGSGWMIPEWDCEQRPKGTGVYEFYFVLGIDWHEGVAYRTGLGRVGKAAWEQLPLEEIEVTLG